MSTRSLTVFKAGNSEIAVMYRHSDGYPTGHGQELADFLKGKKIVNGIQGDRTHCFNGPSALAAQVVAHFTDAKETGNFYLYPAGARDCGEEYTYTIECDFPGQVNRGEIVLKVESRYGGKTIFQGDPSEFDGAKIEEATTI